MRTITCWLLSSVNSKMFNVLFWFVDLHLASLYPPAFVNILLIIQIIEHHSIKHLSTVYVKDVTVCIRLWR